MSGRRKLAKPDAQKVNLSVSRTEIYTGALPSASQIKEIDEAYPGAARILFEELQEQSEHRRSIERMVVGRASFRETLGLIFGFVIALSAILIGAYLIANGNTFAGFGVFLTTVLSMVGLFVRQRYLIDKERSDRLKPMR